TRDGKAVTAANLALVFAQSGRRVLLIDADLRKPGIHTVFRLPNANGLSTVLRGEGSDTAAAIQTSEQDGLHIMTSGPWPPDPGELLQSRRMRTVVDVLEARYDLLVVDSPPVRRFADGIVLSSFIDATLFVVAAGHSRKQAVVRSREALPRAGAHVVGAVLNGVTGPSRADDT